MIVQLMTFSKKNNSTKKPDSSIIEAGLTLDCILLDNCSFNNPAISVIFPATSIIASNDVNYAYLQQWQAYYFVTDIHYNHNRVIYNLNIDVLATYKDKILQSMQFVERSANNADRTIADKLAIRTVKNKVYRTNITTDNFFTTSLSEGYYVIGVIGDSATTIGAVSYYVLTQTQFTYFKHFMLTDYSYMDISDISKQLQLGIINPFKYIVSCKWFPVKPPLLSETTEIIRLSGWTMTGCSAFRLSNTPISNYLVLENFANHPTTDYTWTRTEPYTHYEITVQPWGTYPINADAIVSLGNVLFIDRTIDFITGIGTLTVRSSEATGKAVMLQVDTDIGISIQLAQTELFSTVFSAANTAISGATSALTGNAQGVSNAAGSFADSASKGVGTLQVSPGKGSFCRYYLQSFLQMTAQEIIIPDNNKFGSPCGKMLALSACTGYTQTVNAVFDNLACNDYCKRQISALCNSGIFIE